MKPSLETFLKSARNALSTTINEPPEENARVLATFDAKGVSFDFYVDGGANSLDMLDVVYAIDHDLKIRVDLESLAQKNMPITLQNLYDFID